MIWASSPRTSPSTTLADTRTARPSANLPARSRFVLAILVGVLLIATIRLYGQRPERSLVELRGAVFGTTWSVKLAEVDVPAAAHAELAREIDGRLERVDRLMSTWKSDSELSRFNRHASTAAFVVSPLTFRVLEIARAVSDASGGAFDVSVGPLVQAWGFGSEGRGEPPSDARLAALRERVGFEKLVLDSERNLAIKGDPRLELDLSAVAKGFAVDEVARGLQGLGYERFLVEIGGELRARGTHQGGRPWRVAIEVPAAGGREIHRIVELRERAMATSGDYRNYYEEAGRRVSHTIDPRTGRPIEHALASVTVLHPEAAWADAWATALNVLGPEAGYALAEAQGLAAYFIVRTDPEVGGEERGFETRMTSAFEPALAGPLPTEPSRH